MDEEISMACRYLGHVLHELIKTKNIDPREIDSKDPDKLTPDEMFFLIIRNLIGFIVVSEAARRALPKYFEISE